MEGKMKTTIDLFNDYVDRIPVGGTFQPREISVYVDRMTFNTDNHRMPYDSTITKYIRNRRKLRGDVELKNRNKSIYRKTK